MAAITATKKYSLFDLTPFNRDVRKTRRLEASMRKDGWIDAYPMHCVRNGKGKLLIKAGHHRFEVAQKLGIAVKYVVCEDTATIHQLESATTPWTMADFFESFCRLGKPEYLAVREFIERTGIKLGQAVSLMAGESSSSSNKSGKFKDGLFTAAKDQTHAEDVASIVIACRDAGVVCATARDFVNAVSRMLYVPDFDADTFIRRCRVNPTLVTKQIGVDAYCEMIEYVYNYKSSHKVSLAFPAKDLSRQRSATSPTQHSKAKT